MRLYFPSGDPQGLRLVERSGWTGQGLAFPRLKLAEARSREELKRIGVYVLWAGGDALETPTIYIGQSEDVISRLLQHDSKRDFWTDAVAFTSKDDAFNSAHARYIESELVRLGYERGRATLENAIAPSQPHISEADRADANHFLEEMLTCMDVVGLSAFRPALDESEPDSIETQEFFLKARGISARMRVEPGPGGFVVLAGSQIHKTPGKAFLERKEFRGQVRMREEVISRGPVIDDGDTYSFQSDKRFSSPSAATVCILGSAPNPYKQWKTADGRTLGQVIRGDDE